MEGKYSHNTKEKSVLANRIRREKYIANVLPNRHFSDWFRFWSRVEKTAGCWVWDTPSHKFGYGSFWWDGKKREAHVYAYTKCVGEIPEGLQIDHLCRNPRCVRPSHLEAVTLAQNVLRGESIFAKLARKTHCKRGHALSGDNLYCRPDGKKYRECLTCRREYGMRKFSQKAVIA